ncbi:hypothetical protein Lepto7375DRAFT_7236 [Leptolyngbya sp. PCC 7375]|nr:hypothetical protein Lepto7375DRAFT_7236 [Leptolyngbya sp. PCC 7375]
MSIFHTLIMLEILSDKPDSPTVKKNTKAILNAWKENLEKSRDWDIKDE